MAIIPEHESKFKGVLSAYRYHILGVSMLLLGIIACSTIIVKTQSTKKDLAVVDTRLEQLNTAPDAEFLRNYEKLDRSVKRLEELTKNTISPVKILSLIRELTIPGTTWSHISFDSAMLRISLKGAVLAGPSAIAQIGMQSEIFENRNNAFPLVTRMIDPIRTGSSYAGFSLELTLDQKFFTPTP